MKNLIGLLAMTGIALMNPAQAEGDIEAGRALSTQCSGCHGVYGMSPSEQFPNIAGQKESYLSAQLRKYKSGDRNDLTMRAIVGPLSEEDMLNLAAYFSSTSSVARYSFDTETLMIPYVDVAGVMFKVEMLLDSLEELTFSVTHLEER
ncbi:MAG: c-type cytochrome [Methyloprofundus sp.]|nr:c-type cytochrome [Methyloprofundus sp.]